MQDKLVEGGVPTLPQFVPGQNPGESNADYTDRITKRKAKREFDLALARTSYNYMQSYLEPLPLSADVPKGEGFSIQYDAMVLETFMPLAENFKNVIIQLLERELLEDLPDNIFAGIEASFEKLKHEMSLNLYKDVDNLKEFTKELCDFPQKIQAVVKDLVRLPKDLEQMVLGVGKVFTEFLESGVTAFLRSTMIDMLRDHKDGKYLRAKSLDDYQNLLFGDALPKPLLLTLAKQPWMPQTGEIWEHDWFFGYLQLAGFNTSNLIAVKTEHGANSKAISLAQLRQKFPVTDDILSSVTKVAGITLEQAAKDNLLYVCDYPQFEGAHSEKVHGMQRYLAAPIALFYWNTKQLEGFPPVEGDKKSKGFLQPVAIQLGQKFDAETTPIFTPNNCSGADDANGLKWKIAKFITNSICTVQHESVAHLGACHLTVEPIVIASHRQLSMQHPMMKLLIPHFRFTIEINDSALHSLIVPGGVVDTVIGPTIASTRELLVKAWEAWNWDEHSPDNLFKLRGVDALPDFPFRDDTLELWAAIKKFVGNYVKAYYPNDQDVAADTELQAWINELVSNRYANFKGMNGLEKTGDAKAPYKLENRQYLIDIVSHIIYIAGPQHASVNYAQYPLMTYSPAVSGTIYKAPPTKSTAINSVDECMQWYPPLDIALYIVSFGYLLSGVQFDTFGQYSSNPRLPYFTDPKVSEFALDFQEDLAAIEKEIRLRNKTRPIPYQCQLPSMIPNSISI